LAAVSAVTCTVGSVVVACAARAAGSNLPFVGPEDDLTASARYFNGRAASIYGGSNEIQRNIIAKMVLGL